MLDKNKLKLMVRLSNYEQGVGKDNLRISNYFKKDYVSFNTLLTAIWVTLGYILVVGLYMLVNLETVLDDLTLQGIIYLATIIVGIYFLVMLTFCVGAALFYSRRHQDAKNHIKKYYKDLSRLEKILDKETKK